MTKKKSSTKFHPFVSVITPTFNRRPFINNYFEILKNQTYPRNRFEILIADDGTDKIGDLVASSGLDNIRYFSIDKKMKLGEKRNFLHDHVSDKTSIIVYMDDDDWYPATRIEHCVESLMSHPECMVAGSSILYIYFKGMGEKDAQGNAKGLLMKCGPYGPNHSTAGTFAIRKELLKTCRYNESAALAEEKEFLKGYTIPMVQMDSFQTILVFSHEHNTFDKRKMFEHRHPDFFREAEPHITMDNFFRSSNKTDEKIKNFFLNEIDELLKTYEPGEPKNKPDVLKQMKEIEKERDEMVKKMQQEHVNKMQQQLFNGGGLQLNMPDGSVRNVTLPDLMNMINQLNQQVQVFAQQTHMMKDEIANLKMYNKLLEDKNKELKSKLDAKSGAVSNATSSAGFVINTIDKPDTNTVFESKSKIVPEVNVTI